MAARKRRRNQYDEWQGYRWWQGYTLATKSQINKIYNLAGRLGWQDAKAIRQVLPRKLTPWLTKRQATRVIDCLLATPAPDIDDETLSDDELFERLNPYPPIPIVIPPK